MAKDRVDVIELPRKRGVDGDLDFSREALRVLADGIKDAEVSALTGAEYGERIPDRITHRNGHRGHQGGHHGPAHPQYPGGSYFPTLLEPRRRSEHALLAVIQQGYPSTCSAQAMREFPPGGWTTWSRLWAATASPSLS